MKDQIYYTTVRSFIVDRLLVQQLYYNLLAVFRLKINIYIINDIIMKWKTLYNNNHLYKYDEKQHF